MIEKEKSGHILELYINTNETNSMDVAFFERLDSLFEEAGKDSGTKAVILSGRNEKFFSNGFNPALFVGKSLEEIKASLRIALAAAGKVLFCPKPVVCAMNGHAMGVGAVLAIASDYRIMAEKKGRLGFPESLIGINFPSTSASILTKIVGLPAARDLLYSGRGLKSDEALEIGLIDESAPPEELIARARKWCAQFKDMAMESVVGIKVALRDADRLVAAQLGSNDLELLAAAVASANGQEGMRSILEKRRPQFH